MKIGILTFFRSENFGANLQALSTYRYLENAGHTPVMLYYASPEYYAKLESRATEGSQARAHIDFVDHVMPSRTALCHNAEDINREIASHGIEAVIMGSDAIVQHHPLLSRIHRGNRRPIYIAKPSPERMFPNMFWGIGINPDVKLAYMSVSSQNSEFKYFSRKLRRNMAEAISRYTYISVRDKWTQDMFRVIDGTTYPHTPDPVFAFNANVPELLEDKASITARFGLPERYVLVSLMGQSMTVEALAQLKEEFAKAGLACVSLPMPTGKGFTHNFDYTINEPLAPADWYNLIRHASGYVGSNMHPVIVALHNAVPCYSIDFWGATDFWNRPKNNGSSKVKDILDRFGLSDNHCFISGGVCTVSPAEIVRRILDFPGPRVATRSAEMLTDYRTMMQTILESFSD